MEGMKMKYFYAVFICLILLLAGCAQKTVEQPGEDTVTLPEEGTEPVQEETPEAPPVVEDEAAAEVVDDEAAADTEVTEEEAAVPVATSEVRIVGKAGFDPMEVTAKAGDAITWVNDDSKIIVLTMMKDGKFFANSAQIKSGESFEQEFAEAGTYEYWSLAYGVKGKIIVE
jgi:plastocyanin